MNQFQRWFSAIALICALLLCSGCSSEDTKSPSSSPVSEETSAPIYSNNVPMEYLIMANQSQSLCQNHQSMDIRIEHVLYEDTETWFDDDEWFHSGKDSAKFLPSEDLHRAVVSDGDTTYIEYSLTEDSEGLFLHDAFQLIESNGESEEIVSEAEYEGAFHVITERPIGEEAEYYSMLDATDEDKIREEYVLDSATLSLLINETTLLHSDGSEEAIGTMTITYDQEMPEKAAGLKDVLLDSRSGTPQISVTVKGNTGEYNFSVAEGISLKVLPLEGMKLYTDEKKKGAYQGPSDISKDITLYMF